MPRLAVSGEDRSGALGRKADMSSWLKSMATNPAEFTCELMIFRLDQRC